MCKEKKTAVFLAALCFASYAVSYIGRMNYSAALPGMLAEGALSKKQGGVIAAAYFASYGAGQLLNGFLADRGNPKIQVSAGLAGSALFVTNHVICVNSLSPENPTNPLFSTD